MLHSEKFEVFQVVLFDAVRAMAAFNSASKMRSDLISSPLDIIVFNRYQIQLKDFSSLLYDASAIKTQNHVVNSFHAVALESLNHV